MEAFVEQVLVHVMKTYGVVQEGIVEILIWVLDGDE
jgi:hypothetical protein